MTYAYIDPASGDWSTSKPVEVPTGSWTVEDWREFTEWTDFARLEFAEFVLVTDSRTWGTANLERLRPTHYLEQRAKLERHYADEVGA
jgi:hypothetical protein